MSSLLSSGSFMMALCFLGFFFVVLCTYDLVFNVVDTVFNGRSISISSLRGRGFLLSGMLLELQKLLPVRLLLLAMYVLLIEVSIFLAFYYLIIDSGADIPFIIFQSTPGMAILVLFAAPHFSEDSFIVRAFQSIPVFLICFVFLLASVFSLSAITHCYPAPGGSDLSLFNPSMLSLKVLPALLLFTVSGYFLLGEVRFSESSRWYHSDIGKGVYFLLLAEISMLAIMVSCAGIFPAIVDMVVLRLRATGLFFYFVDQVLFSIVVGMVILWMVLAAVALTVAVIQGIVPRMNQKFRVRSLLVICIPIFMLNLFVVVTEWF